MHWTPVVEAARRDFLPKARESSLKHAEKVLFCLLCILVAMPESTFSAMLQMLSCVSICCSTFQDMPRAPFQFGFRT